MVIGIAGEIPSIPCGIGNPGLIVTNAK